MKHKLKTFGLALGAMLALGALLAAGASAAGERFVSTEENAIVTGEGGPSKFRVGNNSTTEGHGIQVECKVSTYEGTVEGEEFDAGTGTWTTKEVTVHPSYHECKVNGGLGSATVDTDGCDYILTSEINVQETEGEHKDEHAQVEVECTAEHTIIITATGCTIHIGGGTYAGHPSNPGSITKDTLTTGVTYTNLGEGHNKTITVDSTVDSIPYTSKGFLCGFAGVPSSGHDGFYEDDVIVEGKEDLEGPCTVGTSHVLEGCKHGEHVGIWWEKEVIK